MYCLKRGNLSVPPESTRRYDIYKFTDNLPASNKAHVMWKKKPLLLFFLSCRPQNILNMTILSVLMRNVRQMHCGYHAIWTMQLVNLNWRSILKLQGYVQRFLPILYIKYSWNRQNLLIFNSFRPEKKKSHTFFVFNQENGTLLF